MAQFMMPMAPLFGGMQSVGYSQQVPGNSQWTITAQERSNYDSQFNSMNPVNGFLGGDKARSFFLQSNLPPPILGQIWELADITGDGKMDKLEFAIAMKLIKLKLHGVVLPLTLPPSMKQSYGTSMSSSSFSISTDSGGMTASLQAPTSGPMSASSPSLSRTNSITETSRPPSSTEWSVPKLSKLKYTQLFNSNDRNKTGYLSSMQARHVLSNTALPQMTLAKIWQLSDIDNDGKLSQDEFILAMHLADTAKAGNPLPTVLPQHLIPPSYRNIQLNSTSQLGLLMPLTQVDPNAKVTTSHETTIFTTFEDKRRDNFQKGNLELEKRRLALLESQRKEQERLEQKERDEREKREKERIEQERKKQEELERQLERQREAEREREDQRRKAIEQKEAAQREMERQRQMEWERLRRKELLQHKLREQELVTSLRAKTKTLDVELHSHQEKRTQLQERVKDMEARLKEHADQLKIMNEQREQKHSFVQKQQHQFALYNQQLNTMIPEKQNLSERMEFKGTTNTDNNLQSFQRDCQSKVFILQRLRTGLQETESKKSKQNQELDQLNAQLNQLREQLSTQRLAMESMNRIQQDKLRDLQEARRQKDITLTRKASMDEFRKRQHDHAAAFLVQQQEEKRKREEEESRRREHEQKATEERKRAAEEAERRRKQEEERRKQEEEKARKREEEEEAKKAEVKRKIILMQQERMRQRQAADKKSDGKRAAGRGFRLTLSKDPSHFVKYRALYNFTARNPDELSIKADDVIVVDTSQDAEPDWLAGTLDGKSGWFPANYVEKVPDQIKPPPQADKPNKTAAGRSSNSLGASQQSAFITAAKTQLTANTSKPPEIGQRYRAIYPWIAKKENHLSFDKDDIIAVAEKQDMWWFGHCKGKSGWFPKSYVKATTSTTPINPAHKPASPKSSPVLKRKAPAPPSGGAITSQKYVASFAFAGSEAGDLSFNAGDVITVTNMDGEWWTGSLKGKSGIFPANYVAPYKTEQTSCVGKPEVATVIAAYQATGTEQLSLQVGQVVSIRKKNESGWWEGELQARGKKKQVGWFPANYVKLMSSGGTSGKSSTSSADKGKKQTVCRVTAMYDYSAQNSDELTFQRGAVITVDDKSDPDWWKGTLGSASGLFPSNYVQEMPVDG